MYNLHNIKRLAEERKLTIREIGDYCGVSAESIHRSIKMNNISLFTLDKICEYLNLSMSEVINQDIKGLKPDKIQITDANEYLVQRFEEIVRENAKLKDELREVKIKLHEKPDYGIASQPANDFKKK